MLDPRYVAEHFEAVREALKRRHQSYDEELKRIATVAGERRKCIGRLETLRAERNEASDRMAKLDKKSPEFGAERDRLRQVGDDLKRQEKEVEALEEELKQQLLHIPNLPADDCPMGRGSEDNPVLRVWGDKPSFAFEPREHVELSLNLGILDLERAVKLSGARFTVLKGRGALLERALGAFMLDLHVREHGYTEVAPPLIVRRAALLGTGQLPKFGEDLFKLELREAGESSEHDRYLIPTAEVPLTNLHADEILNGEDLPVRYTALTPCFRSEAGSYGKDTRGLIRLHQFIKVEMVQFVAPEHGLQALEQLTQNAEQVLQRLNLHYRVVELCGGDLGPSARKTYDLEVWCPGQNEYREISSCSWCGDFQARRAAIRYRPSPTAKPALVHTLNGSGLAVGRTMVALIEQHQNADGSISIPEALRPYLGGLSRIQ